MEETRLGTFGEVEVTMGTDEGQEMECGWTTHRVCGLQTKVKS